MKKKEIYGDEKDESLDSQNGISKKLYIEGICNKAMRLKQQGEVHETILYLDLAIKLNAQDNKAYYLKGKYLFELGNDEKAIKCFNLTLQYDGGSREYYDKMADLLAKKSYLKEAEIFYKRFIKPGPDILDAYIHLGNCLALQGKEGEAINYYLEATYLDSKRNDVFLSLAQCYNILTHYENAIDCYDYVIENISQEPLIYLDKAKCLKFWINEILAEGDDENNWDYKKLPELKEELKSCYSEAEKLLDSKAIEKLLSGEMFIKTAPQVSGIFPFSGHMALDDEAKSIFEQDLAGDVMDAEEQ